MKAGFKVICFEDGEMGHELWDTGGKYIFSLVSPEETKLQLISLLYSSIDVIPLELE